MQPLYLHVGMMKTGTTYLQNIWRANHEGLAEQDVFFPAGPGHPVQAFAVWDLVGRRPRGAVDDRITGQWKALTEDVSAHADQRVLISEEYLAAATPRQARRAVAGFPDHEVHVVVTARDLGRVLASAWQENVKNGATESWPEFIEAVRDPAAANRDPARGFWLRHDLPTVVDVWASVVGRERVHVVTVPPAGSRPGLLLGRLGQVAGFDPAGLTNPGRQSNESLGAPATEVIRLMNQRLGRRLNQRQYDWVVKKTLQRRLPVAAATERLVLPVEHLEWASGQAERMIAFLRDGGYDVTGDVDDLLPTAPAHGRAPLDVSQEELLEAALDSLTVMAERSARLWWRKRDPDEARVPAGSLAVRASSSVRGAGFRMKRRAAEISDQNPVAARAMGVYLKARAAGRRAVPPRT